MKKTLINTLLFAFLFSGFASADELASQSQTKTLEIGQTDRAPRYKKSKRKKHKTIVVRKRRPRHVTVVSPPRRRVVVVAGGPRVVRTVSTVPVRQQQRVYARRSTDEGRTGLGIRLSGVSVEGQKLNLSSMENPTMGGFGIQFRTQLSRHWGLEVSGDWLIGKSGDFTQTTVPIMLSGMFHFIPEGRFRLYGLFGAGVHLTKLEYQYGFRHDLVELAGQLGAGAEFRFSRHFGINADLRFLGLYKNVDSETTIFQECMSTSGGQSGFCNGINRDDKFNVGAQFMVGATFYF